jgi:hypothetical protein
MTEYEAHEQTNWRKQPNDPCNWFFQSVTTYFQIFHCMYMYIFSDKSIFSVSHFQNEKKTNLHMNQTETPGLCPCILLRFFDLVWCPDLVHITSMDF